MIFNNNTTSLVDNVVMAEGYDGSCGAALALIESARNDFAMFRAMLDVDARELQIQRESAGYVAEGEISALSESAVSGIWNKIKELFKKLAEKIKGIFHVFISKLDSLHKTDKQMVKKYQKELYRKSNLGNLEVKWINYKNDYAHEILDKLTFGSFANNLNSDDVNNGWKEEASEREDFYAKKATASSSEDLEDDFKDKYADGGDPDTLELKDSKIGGIRNICVFLDGYDKNFKVLDKECRQIVRNAEKIVKDVDKYAGDIAKQYGKKEDDREEVGYKTFAASPFTTKSGRERYDYRTLDIDSAGAFENTKGTKKPNEVRMKNTNKIYDMAIAYQNIVLRATRWVLDTSKQEYKQYKAAFMKAIAANDKKLEESAVYLDAVAEAAAEEVESVISGALSKEELSKICNASLNVKDADVSDDPDKLTYGPDYYSDNQSYVRTDGSIDTEINSKSESAFFGQLLY